ncbi:unnamed protein product [Moneuplotes crassus]|uniref:histone acetyltransferase n=1 Tax=Euplotes crassus TaxID=5936 RepID=A0AAD1XDZ3_EUPCR|nr:unnamed protein product [Moneuplotes crassus]
MEATNLKRTAENMDQGHNGAKRVKISEEEEIKATPEERKEYGGLECPLGDVIKVSYVRSEEELNSLEELKAYPVSFPENLLQAEVLKGIKTPQIRLYFTPVKLRAYCSYTYERRAPSYDEPDLKIKEHFSAGEEEESDSFFTQDLDEFKIWVTEEMKPFEIKHEIVESFTGKDGEIFEIIKFDRKEKDFEKGYNLPYQCHLFIEIDNASVIEDDPYWRYYCLFEVKGDSKILAGFTTIYKSFQNLNKFRTRISQFIIFPDYQRKGLAYKLHDMVYKRYMESPDCFQITMESPTPVMSKIYNRCVLEYLLKNGHLDKLLTSDKKDFIKVDQTNILKVLSRSMAEMETMGDCAKCETICCSRIYEFLVTNMIEESDSKTHEILRKYVKKRFYIEFHQDLMPNQRFIRLKKSENRLKAPYCICYEEDGEGEVITINQDATKMLIEEETIKMKLELFFNAFMEQANELQQYKRLLLE